MIFKYTHNNKGKQCLMNRSSTIFALKNLQLATGYAIIRLKMAACYYNMLFQQQGFFGLSKLQI